MNYLRFIIYRREVKNTILHFCRKFFVWKMLNKYIRKNTRRCEKLNIGVEGIKKLRCYIFSCKIYLMKDNFILMYDTDIPGQFRFLLSHFLKSMFLKCFFKHRSNSFTVGLIQIGDPILIVRTMFRNFKLI